MPETGALPDHLLDEHAREVDRCSHVPRLFWEAWDGVTANAVRADQSPLDFLSAILRELEVIPLYVPSTQDPLLVLPKQNLQTNIFSILKVSTNNGNCWFIPGRHTFDVRGG